jgi:hypothetical protein
MPYNLLPFERSLLERLFSKYFFPPGPQALGFLDILIPGAIAAG